MRTTILLSSPGPARPVLPAQAVFAGIEGAVWDDANAGTTRRCSTMVCDSSLSIRWKGWVPP